MDMKKDRNGFVKLTDGFGCSWVSRMEDDGTVYEWCANLPKNIKDTGFRVSKADPMTKGTYAVLLKGKGNAVDMTIGDFPVMPDFAISVKGWGISAEKPSMDSVLAYRRLKDPTPEPVRFRKGVGAYGADTWIRVTDNGIPSDEVPMPDGFYEMSLQGVRGTRIVELGRTHRPFGEGFLIDTPWTDGPARIMSFRLITGEKDRNTLDLRGWDTRTFREKAESLGFVFDGNAGGIFGVRDTFKSSDGKVDLMDYGIHHEALFSSNGRTKLLSRDEFFALDEVILP
jgi:hypothetical protein